MDKELVSIVIQTHNRIGKLVNLLDSIRKVNYPNFEIILVDNASDDGTVDIVRKKFPEVKVIVSKKNLGHFSGANLGFKEAKGEYIFNIDDDNVVDKEVLGELVKCAQSDSKIGLLGPKMYYLSDPKKIWFAGTSINYLTGKTKYRGIGEVDRGQFDKIIETDHIPNAIFIKRKVIDKIGYYSEDYKMTFGESDFAVRARKAGYKVVYCPKAIVWHDTKLPESGTLRGKIGFDTPYRAYYLARNRLIFMDRHVSRICFMLFLFFVPFLTIYYISIFLRYRRIDMLVSYFKGLLDGLVFVIKR
jgi:hypothetical protein